jgi:mono/diheme cytochrome c family protein
LLIAVVSCGDGSSPDAYDPHLPGPLMRPGQDCGRCHSDAGGAESGPPWSAAGTIYGTPDADAGDGVAGVVVRLTDSTGRTRETTTNEVGNFWFEEPLEPPLIVELVHAGNTTRMSSPAPSGYCAACHTAVDPLGPPGRVFVP